MPNPAPVPPLLPAARPAGRESAGGTPVAPQITLAARDWRTLQTPAEVARWDALAVCAAEPNPFFESWYLLPALRQFDPEGCVTLLCLEVDGQLAGLVPVARASSYYGRPVPHWRIWLHANAFLGVPLVARGFERIAWEHLLRWTDSRAGMGLFLHCALLPEHGPMAEALHQVLAPGTRRSAVVERVERAMLSSPLSPEAYLEQSLSAKKRKELRRQHRRLADEGALSVERTRSAIGLTRWVQAFLALEQSGWKGGQGSSLASEPETESLFVQAAEGAARRNRLERLTIRLGEQPIAMLANFRCGPHVFSFKTAYDEAFARFSPGVLLQRENLELLAEADFRWADSCAAAGHPMIDHFWRERRSLRSVNLAVGGRWRRLAFAGLAAWETRRDPAGALA